MRRNIHLIAVRPRGVNINAPTPPTPSTANGTAHLRMNSLLAPTYHDLTQSQKGKFLDWLLFFALVHFGRRYGNRTPQFREAGWPAAAEMVRSGSEFQPAATAMVIGISDKHCFCACWSDIASGAYSGS
jgi:hypothetical protein